MASLDSLPADQRAVIQLVLQRGRSYDEIAAMLSIDRAAVRQRALDAFDGLGPSTSVSAPQRALLTDYLLGQLPPRVAEQVYDRLGSSPPDRAWARVIASEIASLSQTELPEIPVGSTRRPAPAATPEPVAADPAQDEEYQQYQDDPAPPQPPKIPADYGLDAPGPDGEERPTSRRGGAILLGLVSLVIIVIVVIALATGGGGKKKPIVPTANTTTATTSTTASTGSTTSTTGTTTTGTGTTTTPAKLLNQINLSCVANCAKSEAGVAQVIQEGTTVGIVIVAQNVPANTSHNAYAVWLTNPTGKSLLLGFVSNRVTSSHRLETEGELPSTAGDYSQILVTVETSAKPTTPGQRVLEGKFALKS